MAAHYDPEEEEGLVRNLAAGRLPRCPRCGASLARREVPPRDDVSYVRDRIVLVCRGCGRRAALDRRRIQREAGAERASDDG